MKWFSWAPSEIKLSFHISSEYLLLYTLWELLFVISYLVQESCSKMMAPVVQNSVVTHQSTTVTGDVLLTVWLLDLSVSLFIGNGGEPRVGSGCSSGQGPTNETFYADCTSEGQSQYCHFYTASNGLRHYLAMRDNGALETLSVPTDTFASRLEALRRPRTKSRPRLETVFKLTPHTVCGNSTDCDVVSISSLSTGQYIHIKGNPRNRNLTKLHHKATTNQAKQGLVKSHCFKNPGPFEQQIEGSRASAAQILLNRGRPFYCPNVSFSEASCSTGTLKVSYPVISTKISNPLHWLALNFCHL